ncbi:MAG TPA: DPP IV N-terminal domain-containing protein [Candidatus Acidoferrum sp.]|nr:DPP IV N-terminal domain-containing protein [Candidatus Acidoferrum sp.]
MSFTNLEHRVSRKGNRAPWFARFAALAGGALLVAQVWAGPDGASTGAKAEGASADVTARVAPNYALEERFLPDAVNKLVFDLAVTPHWFSESDKFWYAYQTTEGTRYYVVDPVRRAKNPLWDNAKVAAELSRLTNFPYDAQHLPIKRLKLVDKDAKVRFEVEIRKDAVVPNEPKKEKSQEDIEEQGKEGEMKQGEQQGQAATGAAGEKPEETRTIYFEYDLATGKVTRLDNFEAPKKKPMWAAVSPDEKTVVFARGHNLYEMDAENYAKALKKPGDTSVVETQLTTDGVEKYSYARVLLPEQEEQLKKQNKGDTNKAGQRTPSVTIHWSKDSKKFALEREDNRKVGDYWVIHSLTNPRPVLESRSYPLPGETNVPIGEINIFDVTGKQRVVVQPKSFADEVLSISDAAQTERDREELREEQEENRLNPAPLSRLSPKWVADTSDKLYFTSRSRDFRQVEVDLADSTTGKVRKLFEERSNVWMSQKPLRLVDNGKELVWWSERDGWGHFHLYDGQGQPKNQITSGEYVTDQIASVDEKTRTLFFTANGRETGEDPYYTHLYRVGLDGNGLKLLTPGNFTHAVSWPDSGRYFVDTFSRVDTAPKSVLLDGQGTPLHELETTDVSQLIAAGFQYPEMFKVKADDGVTDLYGVIYKPFDFDPSRKYPVIEFVYPVPQVEQVSKAFSPKSPNVPLAQLGFLVIEVGNRGGSPQRDKWYDSYGYGNLRDYGLADKKAALERLAAAHPYMDLSRVGMWGHSGGGFMTAAAMLQYPDLYKAGWSESGNHDNNVYNNTWSEKYHGVREETQKDGTEKFFYEIDKNSELAKNLKGHLMLTTGDMDDNVSMVNTMRLADTLIKANKRFEMLVFPGMRHSYMPINSYVIVARGDFFSKWLLGSSDTAADVMELQKAKQATPSKKFKE